MLQNIFLFLCLVFLGTAVYAGIRAAPWVASRRKDVQRFLKLANISPGQIVYDIGSGDGRMVIAAAKAGAQAIGLEISLFPYLLSKIKQGLAHLPNLTIKYRDFFHEDLSSADVVYIFLMPKAHRRLKEKLEKELRPGAKVITYVWPMPGWPPVKKDKPGDKSITLYLYQMKQVGN